MEQQAGQVEVPPEVGRCYRFAGVIDIGRPRTAYPCGLVLTGHGGPVQLLERRLYALVAKEATDDRCPVGMVVGLGPGSVCDVVEPVMVSVLKRRQCREQDPE